MLSAIEKQIADLVKHLREQSFPVFREDVLKWAEEAIEGTDYAQYFKNGKPTRGWFYGWLRRMEFLTGHLRPLEQTRADWYTPENLKTYFDVAKGVLIKAGVAVLNPDFDPEKPYSEELIITKPGQIGSYDETRVELDCTRGGKGKKDRTLRVQNDDGTTVVTKSDKSASAVCGRLGDGRALPVFVCFASGDSYAPAWAPHYVCDDILDKDGKPLPWRYISNPKGSITEEFCALYIEDVLHPALGYPKPRSTHPGEQGVIICDGVGTHLGYHVVKKAIELGMEIVLRVPHLSFVLQGEDTINFKVKVALPWLLACLPACLPAYLPACCYFCCCYCRYCWCCYR